MKQPPLSALCFSATLAMATIIAAPAMAYAPTDFEMFNMPNVQLNGQTPGFVYTSPVCPTWGLDDNPYEPDPILAGSEISVLNGSVTVHSNTRGVTTTSRWTRNAIFMPSPQIPMFQFWAKRGGYTGSDATSWYLSCGMAATETIDDRSFGRFTGSGNSITCWGPTFDENIVTVPLTDQWQCFTAMGDDTSAYTYYFQGNTLIGWAPCWAHSNPKVYWVTVKSYPSGPNSSYAYLDNLSYGYALTRDERPIVVTESPDDAGAPNPVTGFAAVGFNGQVALSWSNPASWDFCSTMIRFKTTGYPTSVSDGTLLIDQPGLPGSAGGYIHRGLTNGVTYYYSAFAHGSRKRDRFVFCPTIPSSCHPARRTSR